MTDSHQSFLMILFPQLSKDSQQSANHSGSFIVHVPTDGKGLERLHFKLVKKNPHFFFKEGKIPPNKT